MALKVQYNKTFLQKLKKDLKVRVNALPTLQAKESALRVEVKKAKQDAAQVKVETTRAMEELKPTYRLWNEFPANLVRISDVDLVFRKIAGVNTPTLNNVLFETQPYSLVSEPSWIPGGVVTLKKLAELRVRHEVARKKVDVLEYARKKTTQKVNLYEKVQIPAYNEAILKIKRFMEDEENLAKSSQKILKARLAAAEVSA